MYGEESLISEWAVWEWAINKVARCNGAHQPPFAIHPMQIILRHQGTTLKIT